MRCDGETGQPGNEDNPLSDEGSEPAQQYGTLFAEPIRASSQLRLHQRPKTSLHPTDTSNVKSVLARREPSRQVTDTLPVHQA